MATIDADRAQALVGTVFRAQGRDAAGLDCVGLVIAACGLPPETVRDDYRLRGDHRREMIGALGGRFRKVNFARRRVGDLLLMAVADDQLHLGVLTAAGFVHADARLRRVVETPGMPRWPLIAIYRRRASKGK